MSEVYEINLQNKEDKQNLFRKLKFVCSPHKIHANGSPIFLIPLFRFNTHLFSGSSCGHETGDTPLISPDSRVLTLKSSIVTPSGKSPMYIEIFSGIMLGIVQQNNP